MLKTTLKTALLAVGLTAPLTGCDSLHFYSQAVSGHLSIMSNQQPIEAILKDPQTDPALKDTLNTVLSALTFSEKHLALPTQDQYRNYVELDRPYVVWNVVAAEELSLTPYRWCFPVIGCVTYQGYFKQENAEAKAETLASQGYDVYTRGVTAYSTIGWFNDPVLSTFNHYSTNALRALIFHELAHQTVYLKGDSVFNESFAMAVEMEGMRQWYKQVGDEKNYQDYIKSLSRRERFIDLVMSTRNRLEGLYQSEISDDEKRIEKERIIQQLRNDYQILKEREWDGKAYYKHYFDGPLNNAQLNSVATYYALVPGFLAMMKATLASGGTMETFYQQCRSLESLPLAQRHKKIKNMNKK